MRYSHDYDRGYTGYGRGRQGVRGPGRPPETNWMGRNYREPGESSRYYRTGFGGGYPPRHGPRDAGWEGRGGYDRSYTGYDRPYRPLGYDRGFRGRGDYDRGYREMGGRGRDAGRGAGDPWGPYSPYRMLQSRSAHWGSPRPGRFFTDFGHETGPY